MNGHYICDLKEKCVQENLRSNGTETIIEHIRDYKQNLEELMIIGRDAIGEYYGQ